MKNDTKIGEFLARLDERLKNVELVVRDIQQKLEGNYVTKAEFDPVKRVVYGMVGLILTSVLLALIALVIIQNGKNM